MMLNQHAGDPLPTLERQVMRGMPVPVHSFPYQVTLVFSAWEARDVLRAMIRCGGSVELCGAPAMVMELVDPPYEVTP